LAPRLKTGYHWIDLGSQFATLGAKVLTFISIWTSVFKHLLVTWGQPTSRKCSKLAPSCSSPDPQIG
jgi:hypothetical protein